MTPVGIDSHKWLPPCFTVVGNVSLKPGSTCWFDIPISPMYGSMAYGCFLKWWYPQNTRTTILGNPHIFTYRYIPFKKIYENQPTCRFFYPSPMGFDGIFGCIPGGAPAGSGPGAPSSARPGSGPSQTPHRGEKSEEITDFDLGIGQLLVGGGNSNIFWNVHPENWGEWSNLTSRFFRWVETTN